MASPGGCGLVILLIMLQFLKAWSNVIRLAGERRKGKSGHPTPRDAGQRREDEARRMDDARTFTRLPQPRLRNTRVAEKMTDTGAGKAIQSAFVHVYLLTFTLLSTKSLTSKGSKII